MNQLCDDYDLCVSNIDWINFGIFQVGIIFWLEPSEFRLPFFWIMYSDSGSLRTSESLFLFFYIQLSETGQTLQPMSLRLFPLPTLSLSLRTTRKKNRTKRKMMSLGERGRVNLTGGGCAYTTCIHPPAAYLLILFVCRRTGMLVFVF